MDSGFNSTKNGADIVKLLAKKLHIPYDVPTIFAGKYKKFMRYAEFMA
jgi:hypothetical protein